MAYTLTLCIGMFLGLCGSVRTYDYPSLQECEKAKAGVPEKAIGDGYAICAPKVKP
jgi:hypothetical protein